MLNKYAMLDAIFREICNRVTAFAEKQAAAEEKLPQVLETLVVHGKILPEQKAAAAALLRDPSTCMDFVAALARHNLSSDIGEAIGIPVSTETRSQTVKIAGAKPVDWDEDDAGRRFKERLITLWGNR